MAAASNIRDCLMQPIPTKPGPMANAQGKNVGASESKIIFKTIFMKQILFFWEPRNPEKV